MDRGAWQATVHAVVKSWTRLSTAQHMVSFGNWSVLEKNVHSSAVRYNILYMPIKSNLLIISCCVLSPSVVSSILIIATNFYWLFSSCWTKFSNYDCRYVNFSFMSSNFCFIYVENVLIDIYTLKIIIFPCRINNFIGMKCTPGSPVILKTILPNIIIVISVLFCLVSVCMEDVFPSFYF